MKNGKIYKVIIIGCGLIGQKRANSLDRASLVGCCDINEKTAKDFSIKNGNIPFYSNYDKLILDLEFDLAIISATHNALPDLINKTLNINKHILVEKPAGIYFEDLEKLQELASKKKCIVHIGFNHRYHRAIRKSREIIDSGEVGELMFLRARYGHGGRVGYDKEWRSKPLLSGGGELIDQGSHLIDLSRYFLGDFKKINGFAKTYYWKMPVDDNAFMILENEKGNIAHLQVSCTEWKNMFSLEIYGRYGKIDINGLGGSYGVEKITFFKMLPEMGPPETYSWEYPMKDDSWEYEFKVFLRKVDNNSDSSPNLIDAIENLKIINRIYKDSNYDYSS